MKTLCAALTIGLIWGCQSRETKPITLHPANSHYFEYNGKPELLITSAEHYGAVINLDFDYVTYLETLASDGLNLTRVFSGAYVEPSDAFNITKNTLAPASGKFISPWARSHEPGYANGGNKFDLANWDEGYFSRLHDFMKEANRRDIIVELTLFCPFYGDEQWQLSPMNAMNNISSGAPKDRTHVYTLDKSGELLAVQENLVRKMVQELRVYPNLIYEICNEPYFGGVTLDWQHHMASLIHNEEKDFGYQHLISQNIANGSQKITNPHPQVSVFNFHYATPPIAVAQNFSLNKAIGDNETGFKGNADSTYRKEGWAFIFAGGALYNNLDYSFTTEHEDGTFQYPPTQPGGGSAALRKQLSYLKDFIHKFNFLEMRPDSSVLRDARNFSAAEVLAQPGKEYGIYVFGKGPMHLELYIPKGKYSIEFMNPLTGKSEKGSDIISDGSVGVVTPAYAEDVAIRVYE